MFTFTKRFLTNDLWTHYNIRLTYYTISYTSYNDDKLKTYYM